MALDYSAMTIEELESEIEREEGELERVRGEVSRKRAYLELRLLPEVERARGRWRYWREQRRLARAERRELRREISRVLERIRGLERDIAVLRRRLPFLRGYARDVQERLIAGYEAEVTSRWREWSELMRRLRLEVRPRIRETDARYRRELRRFRRLSEEVRVLREDVDREEAERKAIEAELELKYAARLPYKLVEYTKYFEVIVRRPAKTPPIRVELRGEFTVPAFLDAGDPRVLVVIERKLTEAFTEWGKYWMGPFSEIAKALKEKTRPELVWERRRDGWYFYTQSIFLEHWRQGPVTYGGEEVERVRDFKTEVEVEIVKYVYERVEGPWYKTVMVREEEFPSEE